MILVVDAQEGLVEQDMHLMGTVVDAGRALVVAVNKWDHLDPDLRVKIRETLKRRLSFIPWAKIHYYFCTPRNRSRRFIWIDQRKRMRRRPPNFQPTC